MLKILLAVQTPRGRDLRQHTAAEALGRLLPRAAEPAQPPGCWARPQVQAVTCSFVQLHARTRRAWLRLDMSGQQSMQSVRLRGLQALHSLAVATAL